MQVELSVVFCQFNPIYEKLIRSLYSLIKQKGIDFEIIIVDDCSSEDYFDKIVEFFKKNCFQNYSLLKNENNLGTVKNCLNGIEHSKGKYIFLNSPGDILVYNYALKDYCEFANRHNSDCLFARAIYYKIDELGNPQLCAERPNPIKPKAFNWYMPRCLVKHAFYSGTFILGSVFLRKKEYALKYITEISKTSKYVEDNTSAFLSLMAGERIVFYDNVILWYETGDTKTDEVNSWWNKAVETDFDQTWKMIKERYPDDSLFDFHDSSQSRIKRCLKHPILTMLQIIYTKLFKTELSTDVSITKQEEIKAFFCLVNKELE